MLAVSVLSGMLECLTGTVTHNLELTGTRSVSSEE